MTNHRDCDHPATKAGRAACRKGATRRTSTRIVSLWSTATDTRGTSGDFGKVHRADATHTLCGIEIPATGIRQEWANQAGTCTRCEKIEKGN